MSDTSTPSLPWAQIPDGPTYLPVGTPMRYDGYDIAAALVDQHGNHHLALLTDDTNGVFTYLVAQLDPDLTAAALTLTRLTELRPAILASPRLARLTFTYHDDGTSTAVETLTTAAELTDDELPTA